MLVCVCDRFYSVTIIIIRMTNMVCFSFCLFCAAIVYPPVSANVSVNQLAMFNCTAVADVIEWLANNEPVSDEQAKGFHASTEPLNSMIGLRRSKLYVEGREENDNVSITCVAFNNSDPLNIDNSDPALLRVQGTRTMICTVFDIYDKLVVQVCWALSLTSL